MGGFSTLEIGKRALLAQNFGLDVTSNNIANINTDGYSRRQVVLSETSPTISQGNYVGTGVSVASLRSFRQDYYDKEIRNTQSKLAGYEEDQLVMQKVEAILAEPSENGINELVTDFFNQFEEVTNSPENTALRETLLGTAQSLTDRLNSTAQDLLDARDGIKSDIDLNVEKANSYIQQIATLNTQITSAAAVTESDAQTMIDQRAYALEELSKLAGVTTSTEDTGMVNVYINGNNIITGNDYNLLKEQETINSTTGERTVNLVQTNRKGDVIGNLNPLSGEITSQLKHYNVTLDPSDSSGGFSISKQLDEFANALASKVNALTTQGYGMDDSTAPSAGRNFFAASTGTTVTALNISISDDVSEPRDIPLSDSPNEPGNSGIGSKIASLASDTNFISNMTPSEYYSTYLSKIGTLGSDASSGTTTTELVLEQLNNQRESAQGVSLDEEAINLIKYQKGFEAASRIINTTSDLLSTIINLGR